MTEENTQNTQSSTNSPPLELGGRKVIAFTAAGNSVQLESTKAEADAELARMQINSIHRGLTFMNAFHPGPRQ